MRQPEDRRHEWLSFSKNRQIDFHQPQPVIGLVRQLRARQHSYDMARRALGADQRQ
jgi:hypothetical protein